MTGTRLILVLAAVLIAVWPADAGSPWRPGLYVLSQDAAELAVIDPQSETVSETLKLDAGPAAMAFSPEGMEIFITHPESGTISVLGANGRRTISLGGAPFGVAADRKGRLYVSDWNSDRVSVVDAASGRTEREIAVGRSPAGLVLTPDHQFVFVANRESDSVSAIRTTDGSVAATIPVGKAPFALEASPDGRDIYVANVQSASLSIIDVVTLSAKTPATVGAMPYGIAAMRDGATILVANQQAGTVSVVARETAAVIATIKVGKYPEGIRVLDDGSKAYVANWFSDSVSVIDLAARRETRRVGVGGGPRIVALWPAP